jgi:type IV pilus assembly protein PilW
MRKYHRNFELCGGERGYSLVELLVALGVGMIALAAFYGVFTVQNKRFNIEEQIAEMQQNVRAGIETITMDVRMAGYDPAGAANFSGITVSSTQLELKSDLDGDGSIAGAEDIIYKFDSANNRITRNIGAGDQPFMENVQAFTFEYLDSAGNVTTTASLIRQIRISITGKTKKPDPAYTANGGYRTYTLTTYVTPRNLFY